jgi:AcrR family transcriptional regulator
MADAAVCDAVLAILADEGFSGLTIAGIAARAGVSVPTVQRRGATREQLVIEALRTVGIPPAAPDTGSLRGDLDTFVTDIVVTMAHEGTWRRWFGLVGEFAHNAELAEAFEETVRRPRERVLRTILEHAYERGELECVVDERLAVDFVEGPVANYFLRMGTPPTGALLDAYVDVMLASIREAATPAS